MRNREQLIDGVRVLLERRKYGTGASTKFYTWLNYHDGKEWQTYGDPWPSSVIPKVEFAEAIASIKDEFICRDEAGHDQCSGKIGEGGIYRDCRCRCHLKPKTFKCPDCGFPVETEGQFCGDCTQKVG